MEALRMNSASFSYNTTSFVCKQHSHSSSLSFPIRTERACIGCRLHPCAGRSVLVSASLSGESPNVDEAGKRAVASEKAVEGVNQQLHETASKVSHDGDADQVKHVEAAADEASEEASAQASAEPTKSRSGNVGSGHEEGLSAAKKMTPKADH